MVLFATAAVLGATWAVSVWLLHEADSAPVRATARIDAIKTSITVAAGIGAGVALALTARRQWLAERTQGHAEDDAADRRVTELYTMAVEQLGSDNAAVRVGGLYALERLAQDNKSHRQTIVEVICGYLRISDRTTERSPIPAPMADAPLGDSRGSSADSTDRRANRNVAELQVRFTAQRILTTHLQPDRGWGNAPANPKFWSNIDLNLSGASLVNLDLHNCQVANADFRNATFDGATDFGGMRFERRADFTGAELLDSADFSLAEFLWHANFEYAHLHEVSSFEWAVFTGRADFENTIFGNMANFDRARFSRDTTFAGAEFRAFANFSQARFSESASFAGAAFDDVVFTGAHLRRRDSGAGPSFRDARFGGVVRLDDSRTPYLTDLAHAPAWVRTCLQGAAVRVDAPDVDARIWFPGWGVGELSASQPGDSPGTWLYLRSSYGDSPLEQTPNL
ncbi:pentapeptide repeat-containing protein [Amycolatopsis sp. NPDC051045]|uniref:pentapeptide repeat-containing protein n=1 Tax=Amycolatopsis sp. NPDC051045 TaxID=3156922 RepID=UPI00342DD509